MRVVLQRVSEASVSINNNIKGSITKGLLVFLGIEIDDDIDDIEWLSKKITQLRIFNDEEGKMNLSLLDISADILLISQFTLHASVKKGNRPSFIKAAPPQEAIPLYEMFIKILESKMNKKVQTGDFGANMQVQLTNNGPVTILIDSKQRF